ncbi:hypothetical protein GcC1_012037 [Golovinomyces cichoracearum]|uniref:Uncharacterized protein n=1 Tax=Golovinomyces cichoracearum TaxID=62708 RepID=A0A420J7B6_9PEZI|nr:hypothetical protein GcC1_012037 [Golovinomyces cichoracearum]
MARSVVDYVNINTSQVEVTLARNPSRYHRSDRIKAPYCTSAKRLFAPTVVFPNPLKIISTSSRYPRDLYVLMHSSLRYKTF